MDEDPLDFRPELRIMPRCFILQESPSQDFSDLKRFGEPYVVVVGKHHAVSAGQQIFDAMLYDFTSEDFLVPNGSPLGLLFAGAALSRNFRCGGKSASSGVNVLLWDRRLLKYGMTCICFAPTPGL